MPIVAMTDDEALELLRNAIEKEGSQGKLAAKLGVSRPLITQYLNRRSPISGVVANYLGIKRISIYVAKENADDPKQEHYANKRRKYTAKLKELGYATGTDGVRTVGLNRVPTPDLLKEARVQRIERLSKAEAERKQGHKG